MLRYRYVGAKSKSKHYQLKHKYGISLQEYEERLAAQGGMCAICGETPRGRKLGVDHDHRMNEVRGLLCTNCNLLLGYALDRPEILESAILYLMASKSLKAQMAHVHWFFNLVKRFK